MSKRGKRKEESFECEKFQSMESFKTKVARGGQIDIQFAYNL